MFVEELQHQLETHKLEEHIYLSKLTYQQIENINNLITRMLDAARKKIKGIRREVPFLKRKCQRHMLLDVRD